MAKKKSFLESKGFKNFMKYLYGFGAAIVILGALFKIMHWPGANVMLIAGMGTEVLIFAVSAFEPLHAELDWTRVYPELKEDHDVDFTFDDELQDGLSPEDALRMAEQGMKDIELTPDLFSSLSGSLEGLKDNVSKLANIEDATLATNEYAQNIKSASGKVSEMSSGYSSTMEAMKNLSSSVSGAANDAAAYHEQVQLVTKNLSSLNHVYESELKDAQEHIKSLNKFYGSLSSAMNNMVEVGKDTENYKNEVSALTTNLKALNGVYGGMLAAMGGNVAK